MDAGKHLRVLVVGDSNDDFTDLVGHLRAADYWVAAARVDVPDALATALGERWDIVITGWTMANLTALDTLRELAARHLDLPCLVFAPPSGDDAVMAAIHAGAVDFVARDKPQLLAVAVARAFAKLTERRARLAAERELRLSEARFRAGFEVAPEALLTYDYVEARILEANPAAIALFGYSIDELRAMKVGELSAPLQNGRPVAEAAADVIGRARDGGGRVEPYEWTFRAKLGDDIPCEARMVRLPTAEVEIARISIVDLRPRRRLEELRTRAAELESLNRRIQEANRLKSEFLANMSHELRTPLNAIIGFAELLHDGQVDPGSPQHQEFLGDILSSGRHLLQLINDVLDLAKVEAGKLDLRPEPVDPGKIAREVVVLQRQVAAAKRLAVTVDVDAAVGTVTLDPSRFKQVVYNYVSNAIKFTPDGGDIAVRVAPEPAAADRFRLEVRDTGPGIAGTDLARLFVEFQQLESGAAKRHQGTGLGLALVKRLVEAQGGSVGVASEPGRGSTFHASLPRHVRPGLAPRGAATAAPPIARTGAPTVLVVEDDDGDRDAASSALAAVGFAVDVVGTGGAGLARAAARDYDAIVLDMLLPDVTGVDLLAALRTDRRTRDVPVVVVTIVPANETRRVIAAYGVHEVIAKPVDPGHLVASLARAGVRPDRRGGVLVVDDDPSALRLMDAALAQRGLASITRSSGKSALEAAATLAPTAVVVDLVMPGMDGIEFLDQLRRLPEHARTPVVVWTVKDLSAAEREQLGRSAQSVFAKGDSPLGVVHRLQALLGGT